MCTIQSACIFIKETKDKKYTCILMLQYTTIHRLKHSHNMSASMHALYNYYLTDTVSQAVVHCKERLLVLEDLTTDKALEVTT